MTRKYLLTGASGFVGHHMAEAILRRGDVVVALDREEGHNLPVGVQTLVMDLQDPSSMAGLPRSWDGVIHLAGASIPSHFSTPAPVTFNLGITLNLLEHLRDSKVLLVSSCHVYAPSDQLRHEDDPIVPQGRYGLSKHLTEQVAPHYQGALDVRVARPFNHLGQGQRPELVVPSLLRRLRRPLLATPRPSRWPAGTASATSSTCGTWSRPTWPSWTSRPPPTAPSTCARAGPPASRMWSRQC